VKQLTSSGAPPRQGEAGDGHPQGRSGEVAFFDLDRTVLQINSARAWLAFSRREGRLSRAVQLRGLWWMVEYHLGIVDMAKVTETALALEKGCPVAEMEARCERFYEQELRPWIALEARAKIEAHREAGQRVALLTASTQYGAGPVARALKMDLICTELEDAEGKLTGRARPPICYGEGKVLRAEAYLSTLRQETHAPRGEGAPPPSSPVSSQEPSPQGDLQLSKAWFYTDSITDLPVLERVAHPVAVNPDPRLLREARKREWPILRWRNDPLA